MTTKLPSKIVVATDFSEAAETALQYAVALATKLDARLVLVNAIGVPAMGIPELGLAVTTTMMDSVVAGNQAELDKIVARFPGTPVETRLESGDPRDVITTIAKEVGADMIVMGTHGRRGLKRALLGSVAENVLRYAHCPVLVIRADDVTT